MNNMMTLNNLKPPKWVFKNIFLQF